MLAVAVLVTSLRRGSWRAVRVAVMAILLAGVGIAGLPFGLWPAVGLLWLASRRWPQLRPGDGWFPRGRSHRSASLLLVAIVVGAAAALWLWLLSDPVLGDTTLQLVELARRTPATGVAAFVAAFILVNPVVEEVAYRHVAFDASAVAMPASGAVVLQAVAFATLHVVGFPSGAVGVGLAFMYGLALGLIRLLTGGLWLAVVAHMATNATMAGLVLFMVLPE